MSLLDKALISGQAEDVIASIQPVDHSGKKVFKIRLNPDEPIEAFMRPPEMLLSMGDRKETRKGKKRRGGRRGLARHGQDEDGANTPRSRSGSDWATVDGLDREAEDVEMSASASNLQRNDA